MASAGINFSNLTADNGAVKQLKQLIFLALNDPQSIGGLMNVMPKVYNGDRIGLITELPPLGEASNGCDPNYSTPLAGTAEKVWDIKEVEFALALCYQDLVPTLAKYALKTNTNIDDLTGTEYLEVIEPLVESAIKKAVHRLGWFGDKSASVYHSSSNSSGTIKAGYDAKNFNVIDGIWTKLFKAVAESRVTRINVAANAATSVSAQRAAIKGAGVATGIIEEMITSASAELRQQTGKQRIYVTQALADALALDYKHSNIGSSLQFESLAEGISVAKYAGVEIVALPIWDEIIQSMLQNTTNADAWDKPFRAIYTVQDNLLLGTPSESELAEAQFNFDPISRKNYIYAKNAFGVEFAFDKLVVVAY